MITEITGICNYSECEEKATHIASGRRYYASTACYCEKHAEDVADEKYPEFTVECPNCECKFGVN